MDAVVHAGLSNAVAAAALGLVALGVTYVWRNPYVGRCLWIIVLLKLLVPPLWEVPVYRYRPALEPKSLAARATVPAPQREPVSPTVSASVPVVHAQSEQSHLRTAYVKHGDGSAEAVRDPPIPRRQPSPPVVLPSFGTLWLLSGACVAAVILVRLLQFRRLMGRAAVAPASVQDVAARVAARLGITKLPRLRIVDATLPPLVWSGLGRATVLLPVRLIDRLAPEELEAVLAHEFAHVRRRDGWARWLEIATICAYWWHPITWLARHKLQQAEEESCDADVLRVFPELRRGYAQALLDTLEYLASSRTLLVPATGLTRRTCLIRRFEMIVKRCPRSRPARATRVLILSAALAALAAFPVALPAEPNGDGNDRESERIACTITLKDGTQIEGYIVRLADDRVVIQRKQPHDSTAVPRVDHAAEIGASATATQRELWEISLSECLAIALPHSEAIRPLRVVRVDGKLALTGESDDPVRVLDGRAGAIHVMRDVETAYWNLWLKHCEYDIVKAGRDEALEIWRSVYDAHKESAEHTPAAREAQSRAQYFAYRDLVDTTLSDLVRAENRLRYLLGMTKRDERLIQPSDNPNTDKVEFQWDEVHTEALANRTELLKARLELFDRKAELEMARLHLGPHDDHATLRHHQLLVSRERALVRDTEVEVSHQVADALRDVERSHKLIQSRFEAVIVAQQEFETLRIEYELEKVQIDILLDALRRKTDTQRNFYEAVADYALAIARVHERKGTLLERHGIEIVHEAAGEPGVAE